MIIQQINISKENNYNYSHIPEEAFNKIQYPSIQKHSRIRNYKIILT